MAVLAIAWDNTAARLRIIGGGYGSSLIAPQAIISSLIAPFAVADGHLASGLDANKLNIGLLPPARISGLPYGNLYLVNSVVDGDIVDLAATKLTGLIPPARISGLPYSNLYTEIQSFENLLHNGSFEAGDPPTGWGIYYGGETVVRSTAQVKFGSYSVALTNAAASAGAIWEDPIIAGQYISRKMSMGGWVWASAASRVRIAMEDGSGLTYSSYHTGGSSWEWLNLSNTNLGWGPRAVLHISSGAPITAYFDGVILVEGDSCPAFSPKPLDYQGVISGYLGSGQIATPHIRPAGILSASIAPSAIGDSHMVDLAATKLTGLIPPARISGLPYSNLYLTASIVDGDILSGLTAGKLIGTIPALPLSGRSLADLGTRAHSLLQSIGADDHHIQFTSGLHNFIHPTGLIPDLDASKIATGIFLPARISGFVTQGDFLLPDGVEMAFLGDNVGAGGVGFKIGQSGAARWKVDFKTGEQTMGTVPGGRIPSAAILSGHIASGQVGRDHGGAGIAKIAAGSYTGDGTTTGRQITTGFKCNFLIIEVFNVSPESQNAYQYNSIRAASAIRHLISGHSNTGEVYVHTIDGFVVGDGAGACGNRSGQGYAYATLG